MPAAVLRVLLVRCVVGHRCGRVAPVQASDVRLVLQSLLPVTDEKGGRRKESAAQASRRFIVAPRHAKAAPWSSQLVHVRNDPLKLPGQTMQRSRPAIKSQKQTGGLTPSKTPQSAAWRLHLTTKFTRTLGHT